MGRRPQAHTNAQGPGPANSTLTGPAIGGNSADADVSESRLLALSPELRNRIYRYTLVEEGTIEMIASGHANPLPEPGLLATCCQIRSEAKAIYLLENSFGFRMLQFDSTLLIKWTTISALHQRTRCSYLVSLTGNYYKEAWTNALRWVEAYLNDQVTCLPPHNSSPGVQDNDTRFLNRVVRAATRTFESTSINRTDTKKMMERMRMAAAVYEPRWDWED